MTRVHVGSDVVEMDLASGLSPPTHKPRPLGSKTSDGLPQKGIPRNT